MSLRELVAELRRRGVLKTAAAYLAIGWVVLEGLSLLFQNFDAPGWVIKVITSLVILGFPVACLMAWGFDITPEGVRPVPPASKDRATSPVATIAARQLPGQDSSAAPSIAVLPFVDMSAEHDQQYLGDGIAEEVLNALASIEGLNVAARTSSFSFHGKSATMEEIGAVLRVRHVLEGSVRRSGQKLRITAQLIEVASGYHLFTQTYDREMQDIFEIQNDIAREIATALMPKLGLSRDVMLVKQGTRNLEAYNLWLMARQWLTKPSPAAFRSATKQLEEATRLDPEFAEAWGDLAYINGFVAAWAGDPLPYQLAGHHAAETALALSPDNVEGLLYRAWTSLLVHHDAKTSDDCYRRARNAGADLSVWAFNRAVTHDHPMGRFEAARPYLEDAERKDPLAHNLKWALAINYHFSGQLADAVRVAEQLRQLEVIAPDGIATWGIVLGPSAARQAREALATLVDAVPEFAHVGHMYQFTMDEVMGDREHARTLLDGLLEGVANQSPASPIVVAEGYKALGEFDAAIDWWSRAVDQHVPYTFAWMAASGRVHPVIGKHPRFLALLKRMGLEGPARDGSGH